MQLTLLSTGAMRLLSVEPVIPLTPRSSAEPLALKSPFLSWFGEIVIVVAVKSRASLTPFGAPSPSA